MSKPENTYLGKVRCLNEKSVKQHTNENCSKWSKETLYITYTSLAHDVQYIVRFKHLYTWKIVKYSKMGQNGKIVQNENMAN